FLKQINKEQIIELIKGIIIFLIVSSYFLFIFQGTWLHAQPYTFRITTNFDAGGGFVQLSDFGVFYYLILLGIIFALFYIKKENNFPIIVGLLMLVFGLTNYIGFGARAFNLRFYWPIFLSVFAGLPIYLIFKRFKTILPALAMGIILLFIITNYYTNTFQANEGLMNAKLWDMINWIKTNTPEDANLFYFYGDYYDQFAHIGNTNRLATRIEFSDYFKTLQENNIRRQYKSWLFNEHGSGLPYKNSTFKFGFRDEEDKRTQGPLDTDLCGFKYYVIDKASRIKQAADLNIVFANKFLQSGFFEKIYENPMSVILKNNNVGGDCIGK
ncbi:MAG: hypothetical protein Q7R95_04965, partial [bacterium]|nr:hypothetical protein [bacterium]